MNVRAIVRVVLLAVAGVAMLLVSPIFVGDSQDALGLLYENGYGVPQDYSEAVKWYRKAAEQGNAAAQLSLGFNYALGHGVPMNYVLACMWANIVAAQNPQQAIKARDLIEKDMTIWQIYEGKRLAHEWMQQHSKSIQ